MKDENSIKRELSEEVEKLRNQIVELERLQTKYKNADKELKEKNLALEKELKKRQQLEGALRETENLYRTLVQISPDAVSLHTLDHKIIEASPKWLELFRYESIKEVKKAYGYYFFKPEDHKRISKDRLRALEEGIRENLEYIMIRKDGTTFVGELNGALIKDEHGKPKYFIAAIRDITKRKKMEEKLREYSKQLEQTVKKRTIELKEAKKEAKDLREQIQQSKKYPEIVGNSPKILQIIDLIHYVARTNSTVLIYGETGSGKDLIAKAIHYNSLRKEAPFVAINCATLPEQLIESELFGYVKGAFTGATQDKKGLFEEADKGTIFLNEISDIPLRLQGKLLEVLENQQMRRLGQSRSISVDVRIIVASNIDLETAVKKGDFRQDLFYRLNVFNIKVPPLTERKEDIPLLVIHFLDIYCKSINKQISTISNKAMNILCRYDYPGNVRELENIIQHSVIMAQNSTLLPNNLPERLILNEPLVEPRNLAENLIKTEKQTIIAVLKEHKGNLTHTAKKLGISRTTLWRRINKFNIDVSIYVS
jgi:PAS domain S-box-containing protein